MVLSHDRERGRVSLSTKKLEPTPGDMIRNPKLVFEKVIFIFHVMQLPFVSNTFLVHMIQVGVVYGSFWVEPMTLN